MKRLLCIVGSMNAGGAETFLMKMYRAMDKSKYQMDFVVAVAEEGFYDREIIEMGGRIYHIAPKSQGVIQNFDSIRKIVKENRYNFVLRTSQHSLSALELLAAKIGGAKVRVFRSSNSNTVSGSKKQMIVHKLCRFMPSLFANVRIAPSTEAAEFMFGKDCIKKGTAKLIHNAIDTSAYQYNEHMRNVVRDELHLENTFVVGHIGRFNQQKNHKYLIEIFSKLLEQKPESVLVLVGKGELEDKIRRQAADLNIADKVIFLGVRNDIPDLLNAFDIFVFPSFYEGMPNTVIEAQASGLPCVISDTITKEANITGLVKFVPLSCNVEHWINTIQEADTVQRKPTKDLFIAKGYDTSSAVDIFTNTIMEKKC